MDILTQRARVLEALAPNEHKVQNVGSIIKKPQRLKYSMVVTDSKTDRSCLYCKSDHFIYKCQTFKALQWKDKMQWVKDQKLCHNCFGSHHISNCKSKFSCYTCKKRHHSLLHRPHSNFIHDQLDNVAISESVSLSVENSGTTSPIVSHLSPNASSCVNNESKSTSSSINPSSSIHMATTSVNETDHNICLHSVETQILLSTVLLWVQNTKGVRILCRALLDSGSQSNFITSNVCHKLGTHGQSVYIPVTGISGNITEIKNRVNLSIESRNQEFKCSLDFLVLPKITGKLPLHPVQFDFTKLPHDIELADPKFYIPERIDVLIGAETYHDIFTGGRVQICKELPPFQQSVFGYVIGGKVSSTVPTPSVSLFCCDVDLLRKEIQRFYQIEDVKTKNNFSIEEKACETNYVKNVERDHHGRYSVALPFKTNVSNLSDNKSNSLKQFYHLEKKLTANSELRHLYCKFMDEYLSLNHMQLAKQPDADGTYFLPHHAVFKENSITTKLRVVFNGSSKSSSGLSLNDTLMTGPTIQPELFSILIRFRKFKIALSADITKMYRQINIQQRYHKFQQIWKTPEDPLAVYQLNTVTYDTTSAPFLAIRTLKQLATDEHQNFMRASQSLVEDFYVDDFLGGADSVAEANSLKSDLTALLAKGGFELTKWSSNNKRVVSNQDQPLNNVVTTLGIVWNTQQDTLKLSIGKHHQFSQPAEKLNKRIVLSQISQIFDPLGLCAPSVFIAKLFLQKLWAIPNLTWDDELPEPEIMTDVYGSMDYDWAGDNHDRKFTSGFYNGGGAYRIP